MNNIGLQKQKKKNCFYASKVYPKNVAVKALLLKLNHLAAWLDQDWACCCCFIEAAIIATFTSTLLYKTYIVINLFL